MKKSTPAQKKSLPLIERHTVARECESIAIADLERDLLAANHCESGFLSMAAPLPPKFDTRLVIRRKGGKVALCAFLNSCSKPKSEGEVPSYAGSVEILFDFKNDGFGFTQYVVREGQEPRINEFAPYPETKSTRSRPPTPLKLEFIHRPTGNPSMFALHRTLFYAVFREADLFQHGNTIGFNFCRQDAGAQEFSSWSMMAGNGAPDANSLGQLHLAPVGRPRTAPQLPPAKNPRVSITNDSPMVVINRSYTPESLDAEMRGVRSWGVRRLHWIDYSNYPAFWAMPLWLKQYAETVRNCGDLLEAACKAAKKNGVELVPDFKIFDLSFTAREGTKKQPHSFPLPGSEDVLVIPEMVDAADGFMQTNPAWRRAPSFPIQQLRIFSDTDIPEEAAGSLRILQSADNIHYAPVRLKRGCVSVKQVRRPNRRWSPDGFRPEKGTHRASVLEIQDVKITEPFIAIEIDGLNARLRNRHFALVEAIGKDGSEAPFICSDTKPHRGGNQRFDFYGNWPAWNNYNDHAYGLADFSLGSFGIALVERPALTGMLEPTHPKAHKIWLDRIDHYLNFDVAGVSIRTLCHHRRCHSWLQYAFAPSAITAFESKHGRSPDATEKDFALMRHVRGEALGDFLSAASAKIRAKKKKSIFQVETGGELPADHESRMAMYYDYEKWISSGLFDELHVRSITGHSPWLRQVILPLARKHGVEVHLMTRNHATGFGVRDLLEIKRIASDALSLGYSGVNFYESANLYELTEVDSFIPRAMAELCVREAVSTLFS